MGKKFDYNLIVIGAGSAGLVASYIAASVKAKVLLIEKNKMGGDCLNTGCVPSKALIQSAKYAHSLTRGSEFGFENVHGNADFKAIMDRVRSIIKAIEPNDSIERYQSLGVDVIQGDARFLDAHSVEVDGAVYSARDFIIASGASPFIPPIKGIDTVEFLTSDNLWQLNELPKHLIVLGGGAIGCELSQAFKRLGSDVTLVEMQPTLIGRGDSEAAELLRKVLEGEGVDVRLGHEVTEVHQSNAEIGIIVKSANGVTQTINCDALLVAVGRKANTEGFGLKKIGVDLDRRGRIKTDERLRTSISNIFAAGDVTGDFQFTHTASHEAWYAVVNSLFNPVRFKVDYRVVPKVIFTEPEIAEVGLGEIEIKERNMQYVVSRFEFSHSDRSITESETKGFIKVFTKGSSDKILGAVIVGHNAGEILAEIVIAMKHGHGLNKVLGTIHAYPTYAEINKSVAGVWRRQHKPDWILALVAKWHKRYLKNSR